jgi:DNA helicase HerA-like ATPase
MRQAEDLSRKEDGAAGMEEIGRVAYEKGEGPTYDRAPVVASKPVQPYEPVVIEGPGGPGSGERLWIYGRVVQGIEVNYEATPERLRRREAYDLGLEARREDSPDLFRLLSVEILGALRERGDGLEALEPEILPETGARVFRMPPRLLEAAFGLPRDGLDIGRVAVGLRAPFRLSREALPRGIGIFGRPGTGKSYAAGVLIEEIHKLGIPSLIIDVNGETIGAARRLGGVTLEPGRSFKIPLRYLEFSELEALLPNLTEVQKDLISAAFEELLEKDEDFGVEDLASKIEEIGGQLQARPDAVGRAVAKVRRLGRDPLVWSGRRQAGAAVEPEDWARLFAERRVVNIYMGGLTQERRDMAAAALCRMLQSYRERSLIPPFAFVLDEAHAFVPSGGSETASRRVIRNFIRRGRHLKIASIMVSQSPAGIDRQVLLLLNTRFIFALDGEDLRALSGFLADAPQELIDRIPKLPQGTAVVAAGAEICRHVLPIRFRERRTPHGAPTPDLAEEARKWLEGESEKGRRA